MPPILRTAPRSPDFVRKECSSQNPYRLICAGNEPASFQSFVMWSTLSIPAPDRDFCGFPLHGVVTPSELGGVEQHAQDLHVVLGCNAGDDDAHDEQSNAAEQGVKEREDRSSRDQSDEE